MLEDDDQLNAHAGGRSATASVLFAAEGLLEVAAEFVDDGRPDVAARATLRAALLLEVAEHPDARTVHSLRLDLEHPEGSENHDGPLTDVLRHEAFLVRRDASYLEAVAGDPRQADAGSWIEDPDHPHHQPDPWVDRGQAPAPRRLMGEAPATEQWRDAVIATERGGGGYRARPAPANEAARIAAQGQVPMRSAASTRHPAADAAAAISRRGAESNRAEVDR